MADTTTFEQAFAALYREAFDLLVARQRKYGPRNIERLGIHGVLSRLAHDKVERVMRTMNGRVVNGTVVIVEVDPDGEAGDTFEDALLDIANYALIALAQHRGLWGRPLGSERGMDDVTLGLLPPDVEGGQGMCPDGHLCELSTVQRDGDWVLTRYCPWCGYEGEPLLVGEGSDPACAMGICDHEGSHDDRGRGASDAPSDAQCVEGVG